MATIGRIVVYGIAGLFGIIVLLFGAGLVAGLSDSTEGGTPGYYQSVDPPQPKPEPPKPEPGPKDELRVSGTLGS